MKTLSFILLVAMLGCGCSESRNPADRMSQQAPQWVPKAPPVALNINPMVFELVPGWLSDTQSPVVTEINLDAVQANRNQFDAGRVRREGDWRCVDLPEGAGYRRYRVVASHGRRFTVEYQSNGGGTLTTSCLIEVELIERQMPIDGQTQMVHVMRVLGFKWE